ncbi:MAG: hypothetical protein HETSPECPRED_009102 [Heterodermia speciosa]|uniref:IgE-binding protein n=1 Tax=Heterodermia speciosa TaxID=116794 RepID=A0A8H3IVF6_9LECA|nr:MAG: hypothetical protein HETSPECPRED_009102 [Heterodermia speciosa]
MSSLTFFSSLILLFSVLTSANPVPLKQLVKPKPSGPFTMVAVHSTSPIHLKPVNAQRNHFYIGNATQTFCPQQPDVTCPIPGNTTVLQTTSRGYCNLDVEVPGGQHVYVAANGALAYTVPNSNIVPKGAHSRSFALDRTSGTRSSFTYSGTGKASGWLACPVAAAVYQIFANVELEDQNVPQKNVSACIALDALTTNYTLPGAAAWQYT